MEQSFIHTLSSLPEMVRSITRKKKFTGTMKIINMRHNHETREKWKKGTQTQDTLVLEGKAIELIKWFT